MRLLSYNIHKGIGGLDRRYDLGRIIDVIQHENPDVICLQEVTQHARRTLGDDQPKLLKDALVAIDSTFQMNVHYAEGGYGNLILSRWRIIQRHHISLRRGWRKSRGGQLVVIDAPEGAVHIAHWHLGLADRERIWQADHLLNHSLFRKSTKLPTMIVGDSNDWRNKLADGPLGQHGFVPITTPPSRFRTFPAFLTALSLDKAFHRGLVIQEVRVVRTKLAHQASDHLPLVVDFHVQAIPTSHSTPSG